MSPCYANQLTTDCLLCKGNIILNANENLKNFIGYMAFKNYEKATDMTCYWRKRS